jgi:hypothetical protein
MSYPWEGTLRCGKAPEGCPHAEIEGLGFCFLHIPAADLEEAELITGWRRCRWGRGRCHEIAAPGREPSYCPRHHQVEFESRNRRAGQGFVNEAMGEQLAAILAEHGEYLLHPPAIGDPLEALMTLADQIMAFCEILRQRVARLEMSQWRYAHDRAGEQVRTELYLYERALDRAGKHLTNIAKLRIREHKLELEREVITVIQRALGMALEASGLDLVGQQKAREVLARELEAIEK